MNKLSKRAIPILIITILLTSILPIMPANAIIDVNVSGADTIERLGELYATGSASAEWTIAEKHSGLYSVELVATGVSDEASIFFNYGDTLGSITSVSYYSYVASGELGELHPYVYLTVDTDADGLADVWVVQLEHASYGTSGLETWVETIFNDDSQIHVPVGGPLGYDDQDPATAKTLGELKLETGWSDYTVLEVFVELGQFTGAEIITAYVDDVTINGVLYHFETGCDKGDELTVSGTGVTAGSVVNVYWDAVNSGGLKNSTEAKADGSYECTVDVPSDVAGEHWVWVKDLDTGTTKRYLYPIYVLPKLSMSPSSGLPGDKITITGYGFSSVADVTLTAPTMTGLSTTPATPETDELGYFTASFTVPADIDYTDYPITATDEKGYTATKDFTVGACISLDVAAGPVGSVVEIKGHGFKHIPADSGPPMVPSDIDTITDAEVQINGDGVSPVLCTIVDYDDTPIPVKYDGTFKFEIVIPQVDMDKYDTIEVKYEDGVDKWTSADFEVTGEAEIELDPEFGVQGTTVSIEGLNFIQISGEEIEIWLCEYDEPYKEISRITYKIETDSNGEFTDTFSIPAKSSGQYKIKAKQGDYNIYAYASFRIGLMIVIPTPTSGPTGTEVILTGTGFTELGHWNATFGDITIVADADGDVDDESDLVLNGAPTFYVPTIEPGTYTISILDIDSGITVDVDWTVTATSKVEIDPIGAPNDYIVKISGTYFAELEDGELEFVLYNVTDTGEADDDWDITSDVYPDPDADWLDTTLDEDGNFIVLWKVLGNEDLSIGDYILNVTDEYDLFAQVSFTVVAKSINVNPRKSSFARGETVAFNIESSFIQIGDPGEYSYIEVYDPTGDLYWTTDEFTDGDEGTANMWLKVGTIQTVPYYYQTAGGNSLFLLEDAPLGTWSWEWVDWDDDVLDRGTFTVTEAAADVLSEQLTQLNADLTELATDFESVSTDVSSLSSSVAALSDSVAQAIAAANAANNAVQDVAAAVASVADTAANAADAANAAATAATSAKVAADSAGASASGLTNLVYGAIVAALVAALAAIVSLMQISKRIAG